MKTRPSKKSSTGRKRSDLTLSRVRSAISNGSAILPDIDHRSSWMRRYRDLIAAQVSDLGGSDTISEAEKVLARRCAMLTLQLEMMEQRWADNDGEASPRQLERYTRVSNTLRRLLSTLGLEKRPRDITPSDRTQEVIEHIREVTAG